VLFVYHWHKCCLYIHVCVINRSMVNKPKEFAHLLKDKFGSADQINMLGVCYAWLKLICVHSFTFFYTDEPFSKFYQAAKTLYK